ncbi:hypothetical protein [Sulfobacillus thermosulfidooxidans]|nr:hypothetical protein [Sulfobacillus thermosulfidooxidans]
MAPSPGNKRGNDSPGNEQKDPAMAFIHRFSDEHGGDVLAMFVYPFENR